MDIAISEAKSDPVVRVRDMGSSLHQPVYVKPDDQLATAVTHMLTRDFSQLPVYSSPRALKGVVSWRTIGTRAVLAALQGRVQDFMEPAATIDIDRPIFEAVDLVAAHDYVVVMEHRSVSAILTASDFSLEFKALSAPFLLIGEIEHGLRQLLNGRFAPEDILKRSTAEKRKRLNGDSSELAFGEYVLLFQNREVWARLNLTLDQTVFTGQLETIRKIRNKVMHFRPGGVHAAEIECLEAFARFLRRLREVSSES